MKLKAKTSQQYKFEIDSEKFDSKTKKVKMILKNIFSLRITLVLYNLDLFRYFKKRGILKINLIDH